MIYIYPADQVPPSLAYSRENEAAKWAAMRQWVQSAEPGEKRLEAYQLTENFVHTSSYHQDSLNFTGLKLKSLPEEMFQLDALKSKLRILHLYKNDLLSLPSSIGELRALERLQMACNCNLGSLPDSIGQLVSLKYLEMACNHSLVSLPDSIGQLVSLKSLDLTSCFHLTALPSSIGQLSQLESIHLCYSSDFVSIPDSIGNLTALKTLHLSHSNLSRGVPDTLLNLSSRCVVDLTGSKLGNYTIDRLQTIMAAATYTGPQIRLPMIRGGWVRSGISLVNF